MNQESTQEQVPRSEAGAGDPRGADPGRDAANLENSLWLVRRAQGGDLEAYDRLFARYYLRVLAIVRARLGARLRRDVDSQDVAQEAMVEAIRDFPRFRIDSTTELKALFAIIVENRMRANARRQGAAKRDRDRERALDHVRESLTSGTIDCEPADDEPLPPELVALAERQLLIDLCLSTLEARDQLAIRLREYEGLSWEAIAERIESPTANAARMTYARALIRLKEELERRGELGDAAE